MHTKVKECLKGRKKQLMLRSWQTMNGKVKLIEHVHIFYREALQMMHGPTITPYDLLRTNSFYRHGMDKDFYFFKKEERLIKFINPSSYFSMYTRRLHEHEVKGNTRIWMSFTPAMCYERKHCVRTMDEDMLDGRPAITLVCV